MTQDEIIEMAEQCGLPEFENNESQADNLVRFFHMARAAEREACAKVCDSLEEQCEKLLVPDEKWPTPSDCANIIRARGQA